MRRGAHRGEDPGATEVTTQDEAVLPGGWCSTDLETLTDPARPICYGILMPKENLPDGVPYVKVKDIKGGRIVVETLHRTAPAIAHKYRRSSLQPGDLLLAIRGTYGRVAPVPPELAGANITQDTARVAILPGVDKDYIAYHLIAGDTQNFFKKVARGVAVKGVNIGDVKLTPIRLAPVAEQRRIVEAIEVQLTRLDAAVAALGRAKARLKRYRAAVLRAACEGRLVPTEAEIARAEGRDYEPADCLLARIFQERRAQSKDQSSAPANTDALPDLPMGWIWARARQIAAIQGGIQKQPKRRPKDNSYPFLRVANVYRNRLDLEEVHRIELFGDEIERLRLESGDLLIVEGNGSPSEIGRMAIWAGTFPDCVHQNHIIRARLSGGILPQYVSAYWNSPDGSSRVMQVSSSTSGLHTLSVSKVNALPIPLPPLAEQSRIVAEVERRLSLIDELESTVTANLKRAERLRQSILKRAFEGKLVPQDPADEPASALLARIKASPSPGHEGIGHRHPIPPPSRPTTTGGLATQATLFPDTEPTPRPRRKRRG